jgi:signal recognition particle subunit SRP54
MTLKERRNPQLFKKQASRRLRVVKGSGRKEAELNKLLAE